jgi:hypothetical protein
VPTEPEPKKATRTRSTRAKEQPAPGKSDAVRDVLVEAARTQLAAVTAATTFWAGWAEQANVYAKAVSDELSKLDAESGDTSDALGRISDLTREYLRDLTQLPTASVQHFNGQLEKIGKRTPRPARAARVKS